MPKNTIKTMRTLPFRPKEAQNNEQSTALQRKRTKRTRNLWKKEKRSENYILQKSEIEKLLNTCETEKEKNTCHILLYTGLRATEFVHMTKDWIQPGHISIPFQQPCSCYECRPPLKGGKPKNTWQVKVPKAQRTIPIVPEVRPFIEKYFSEHDTIMETIPNRVNVWITVKKVAKRAEIPHLVYPHVLRATFATILASKNFGPDAIKSALGWEKYTMAERYVNLKGEWLEEQFNKKW